MAVDCIDLLASVYYTRRGDMLPVSYMFETTMPPTVVPASEIAGVAVSSQNYVLCMLPANSARVESVLFISQVVPNSTTHVSVDIKSYMGHDS
jgi:hypothetical protein